MQNRQSLTYDELWRREWRIASDSGPSARTRFRIINRLLLKYAVKSPVLDVGAGNGALWSSIQRTIDLSISAIDISEEAVNQAVAAGIDAVVDDITAPLSFKNEVFSCVCCIEVLEHIEHDDVALQNCYKALKPGGVLLVSVPHSMKYWTKNDNASHHIRRYELLEMQDKLRAAGFQIMEMFTWGAFFYKPYYRLKGGIDSGLLFPEKASRVRKILSQILYALFYLEDFATGEKGVALYAVARKPRLA